MDLRTIHTTAYPWWFYTHLPELGWACYEKPPLNKDLIDLLSNSNDISKLGEKLKASDEYDLYKSWLGMYCCPNYKGEAKSFQEFYEDYLDDLAHSDSCEWAVYTSCDKVIPKTFHHNFIELISWLIVNDENGFHCWAYHCGEAPALFLVNSPLMTLGVSVKGDMSTHYERYCHFRDTRIYEPTISEKPDGMCLSLPLDIVNHILNTDTEWKEYDDQNCNHGKSIRISDCL